ncbi:MAG: stringent starvation protein B [Leptospiraceae bacterium]|nr:stringent starvation protein B [Leptospiraceae bacterium]
MDTRDPNERELLEYNRKFKKAVLDVVFHHAETFYVHCMPNAELQLGRRGLLDREKNEGIILVFGPYSTRNLSWDDRFIYCELQFNRWENVQIPFECIARIFDKSGQVIMQWATMTAGEEGDSTGSIAPATPTLGRPLSETDSIGSVTPPPEKTGDAPADEPKDSRVIEVDFRKKKR